MLKTRQVCELLGICRETLVRWVKEGKFPPPVRLGTSHPRWHRETVAEWVNRMRTEANAS
jgi:prophage regulatory protein